MIASFHQREMRKRTCSFQFLVGLISFDFDLIMTIRAGGIEFLGTVVFPLVAAMSAFELH